MLKRVGLEQVRLGMFVHDLCGSWMDHPFWRGKFLIESEEDLRRLRASSIREVWIDTAKGLDVELGQDKQAAEAAFSQLLASADQPILAPLRVSIEEEMSRAARIVSHSSAAVSSMFREVRMGQALNTADALPLVEEISHSVLRNPGALISLARLKTKDNYTYMHSVAVCALMVALARQLGMDEAKTRQAGLAGLLHDIGKMEIPFEILDKPGRLTDEEFDIIKRHPAAGHALLLQAHGADEIALDVVLHHHEKIDGSGYPNGLRGDAISLFAKMGAVCDVYDAITSNRPYKNGWDPAESLRKMTEWSHGHFDERVFRAFVKSLGIYPIGSLVRLESGRLGVVVEQSEKSLLVPMVKVFFSTRSNVRIAPELLDLSRPGIQDKIIAHENPDHWHFPDLNQLWGA